MREAMAAALITVFQEILGNPAAWDSAAAAALLTGREQGDEGFLDTECLLRWYTKIFVLSQYEKIREESKGRNCGGSFRADLRERQGVWKVPGGPELRFPAGWLLEIRRSENAGGVSVLL